MATASNGTALITGASSGIGAVYARRLAERGHDLILVARRGDALRTLARAISDRTGRSVEVLTADLGASGDLARIEKVLRHDQSITLLVNNAGIGATAPVAASEVEAMQSMIELNVTALTRLSLAAAPGFAARGVGTIVNIGSIVAVAPEALNGVYGGTKAFVLAFSQALHHELSGRGVRVQVVLPGATATGFWDRAGTPVDRLPKEIVMAPEALVEAALCGLDQGELVTIPSLPDLSDWDRFEAARLALRPSLSRAAPAARYGVGAGAAS